MSARNIAMIPARMGSQRLVKKNLRELGGVPLIVRAIRKCIRAEAFDEIWLNSEHDAFAEIAEGEGVQFHKRPAELANHTATSEDFVYEFMKARPSERLFQVHSIAPLLGAETLQAFVANMQGSDADVLLSCVNEQIECAYENRPINFSFDAKTNSQELKPVQRITWSVTGWKSEAFIAAIDAGNTATYAGRVEFFPINRMEGHIIKTEEDLQIAEAMLPLAGDDV